MCQTTTVDTLLPHAHTHNNSRVRATTHPTSLVTSAVTMTMPGSSANPRACALRSSWVAGGKQSKQAVVHTFLLKASASNELMHRHSPPHAHARTRTPARTRKPAARNCCTTRRPVLPVAPATNTCASINHAQTVSQMDGALCKASQKGNDTAGMGSMYRALL